MKLIDKNSSFCIEKTIDPRWKTYVEWIKGKSNGQINSSDFYLGIDLLGYIRSSDDFLDFDHLISLDFFFENIYANEYYEIY